MNKRLFKILGLSSLVVSSFYAGGLSVKKEVIVNAESSETVSRYTNHDGATYYNGISDSLQGDSLLASLRSLNSSRRKSTVGYKPMLNNPSQGYYVTDPGNGSGTISPFYNGGSTKGTSGLNREHVWPNSRGGNYVEADIHMTRPTYNSDNGSRGNSFYVEGSFKSSGGWDPGCEAAIRSGLDPTYRGDCARIIFYCVVASSQLKLVDKNDDSTGNNSMGKLSDLLKWNLQYPVKDREKTRNEGAEQLQGNRNPFIDNPSYACRIWGATNATTQQICSGQPIVDDGGETTTAPVLDLYKVDGTTNSKITVSETEIGIGEVLNLVAYTDGVKDNQVTWSISGDSVVSNKFQTYGAELIGAKAGNSTITFTKTYDGNKTVTKSLTVKVKGNGSSGETTGQGSFTITKDNLKTAYPTTEYVTTISGVEIGMVDVANYSSTIQMKKTSGCLYNKTSLGCIKSITFQGKGGSGTPIISFGDTLEAAKAAQGVTFTSGISSDKPFFYIKNSSSMSSYTSITVEYGNEVQQEEKVPVSLSSSGTCKTDYKVNNSFDPTGLTITATYSDDSTKDVTNDIVWLQDTLTYGMTSVTGRYTEGDVNLVITIQITVTSDEPITPIDDGGGEGGDDSGGGTGGDDSGGGTGGDGDLDPINPYGGLEFMGCTGSIITSAIVLSIAFALGAALLLLRKRKEN